MAYDKDASFSLSWTSPRYARYKSESNGRWRLVTDGSDPVGIIWTDNSAAAGVSWVTQTTAIDRIRKHFGQAFEANTTASMAYQLVESLPDVKLLDEDSGRMSAIDDELEALKEQ